MRMPALIIALLTFALPPRAVAQVTYQIPFPQSLSSQTDTVSMLIMGDVMMHKGQLAYDFVPFLSNISAASQQADIAVANLEFTLGGEPYSGYPCFSAPDEYAEYLAGRCGVDVFLTANNHILDRGRNGLLRTLGIYGGMRKQYGVRYAGSSVDSADFEACNPLIVTRNGIRIAIINFTYGTNAAGGTGWPKVNRMRQEEVEASIAKARAQRVDFIVALPHWGEEYKLRHSESQEKWAEWLVSKGVDAIVGSHPHVVQDTAHIKGVPVIYSMGNVVSNMSAVNTRLGMTVTLRFAKNAGEGSARMLEPQLDFTWCTLPDRLVRNYSTIYIKEWAARRGEWLTPDDFDNMFSTLQRVKDATGLATL